MVSSLSLMLPAPHISTLFPYTTLFRSLLGIVDHGPELVHREHTAVQAAALLPEQDRSGGSQKRCGLNGRVFTMRSEEHTSELQSRQYLVCRLLLEKKKTAQDEQIARVG